MASPNSRHLQHLAGNGGDYHLALDVAPLLNPLPASVKSCLPKRMLIEEYESGHPGSGRAAGDGHFVGDLVQCQLKVPKKSIGKLLGPKGESKKRLEEALGQTFELDSILAPPTVTFKGTMEDAQVFYKLIMQALEPHFEERDVICDITKLVEVEPKREASGLTAFEIDSRSESR